MTLLSLQYFSACLCPYLACAARTALTSLTPLIPGLSSNALTLCSIPSAPKHPTPTFSSLAPLSGRLAVA